MIPVPGFDELRIQWVQIQARGYSLYGFILYSEADRQIIEFMKFGLRLLDEWSGPDTAIFAIEPPNREWVTYLASRPDHPAHLFDRASEFPDLSVVLKTGEQFPVAALLEPQLGIPYNRNEVEIVRQYFGLAANEYPCLVFFEDLSKADFHYVPMPRFPDVQDVRYWMATLFESNEFVFLVDQAKAARGTRV